MLRTAIISLLLSAAWPAAWGQSDPYRGLWVGEVTLKYVNEVAVPLDENNVSIAPDPEVPTPTADQAHLRLILHVNGAGQVNLLKDVAILHRDGNPGAAGLNGEPVNLVTEPEAIEFDPNRIESDSDVALITDERLYGEFPPQPAVRIASAVFDFGDSRATAALDEVVRKAAAAAGSSVFAEPASMFTTSAGRVKAENAAQVAAEAAAAPEVASADAATRFGEFLRDEFDSAEVDALANAASSEAVVDAAQGALNAAILLRESSFYQDNRGVAMVEAVASAMQNALNEGMEQPARRKLAQNIASAYADTADNYQRFIAGKAFGDMIDGGAGAAAAAAVLPESSAETIRNAVNANGAVIEARSQALTFRVSLYQDTRATDAVELVLDAVINTAASALPAAQAEEEAISTAADQAGRTALANDVARYPVPVQAPTLEYNQFVTSAEFAGSPAEAAAAAAAAAVSERVNNALYTEESIQGAALAGAVTALRSIYGAAARTVRTELPLAGTFAPGQGDPRLSCDIKKNGEPPLGPAALEGTIFLPASHPTNPFRHRRHADHTVGFDIMRKLRLDFDGSEGDALASAGYGVDRITGTYREEIFGLHKPLGPNRDGGLKVEGTFELNRISLIDTVNAR